jgi:hypothetical protein
MVDDRPADHGGQRNASANQHKHVERHGAVAQHVEGRSATRLYSVPGIMIGLCVRTHLTHVEQQVGRPGVS